MAIDIIRATVSCDGCNHRFTIDLDAGYVPPAGWSLWDVAKDACRGAPDASVQSDYMLCHTCSAKVDQSETVPDDRNATAEEVQKILGCGSL